MSSELTPTPELLAGLWNRMRVSEHGMKHTCYYEFFDWHAAELAAVKAEGWEEGHSWGWSDAQEAHDVRQDMAREDWSLKTPNPYRDEEGERNEQ